MVTSWIWGWSMCARELALVDEDRDVAHAALRVEPAGLVLERREDVGPLVDVYLRERHLVLRGRDHDVVVADGRLAVVRVPRRRRRGVGRHDGNLFGEDPHDPAADRVAFGVGLLHEGITHLHEDEVGRRCHLLVAGQNGHLAPWSETAWSCERRALSGVTTESLSVK